ncbi:hypothetical protein V8C86DRAFT_2958086, partial [Haematococcus lacustris]
LYTWKEDQATSGTVSHSQMMLNQMFRHREKIKKVFGWQITNTTFGLDLRPKAARRTHQKQQSKEERTYHWQCLLDCKCAKPSERPGSDDNTEWECPSCAPLAPHEKEARRAAADEEIVEVHWEPSAEAFTMLNHHTDFCEHMEEYKTETEARQHALTSTRKDGDINDDLMRQSMSDTARGQWQSTHGDPLRSKIRFDILPTNPQLDICPTGSRVVAVYNTDGKCMGVITPARAANLLSRYNATQKDAPTPLNTSFAAELASLLARHGQATADATHTTPTPIVHILRQHLEITKERYTTPLHCSSLFEEYYSPCEKDKLFGSLGPPPYSASTKACHGPNPPKQTSLWLCDTPYTQHKPQHTHQPSLPCSCPTKDAQTLQHTCGGFLSTPTCAPKLAPSHPMRCSQTRHKRGLGAYRTPAATNTTHLLVLIHNSSAIHHLQARNPLWLNSLRGALSQLAAPGAVQRIGAGIYHPQGTQQHQTINPSGEGATNTITRAELAAIKAALDQGHTHIATDSLTAMFQIRMAVLQPMRLHLHKHKDILTTIVQTIKASPTTIHLFKVRAHNGIIGNEYADHTAKLAAQHDNHDITIPGCKDPYHDTHWLQTPGKEDHPPRPLGDLMGSLKTHMHIRHRLGLANQDSIYYEAWQSITLIAHKMSNFLWRDGAITTPQQRCIMRYRTGTLYNQKHAHYAASRTALYTSCQVALLRTS